ncbi:MAG: CheR family methyltransferase [Gemmatimonadales bacterium]
MTAIAVTPTAPGPRPLSDREFRLFQRWIYAETGINLTDAKRALLVGRLWRRVRELGCKTYEAYFTRVEGNDPAERVRLINAICTHETQFFREPRQFEYLEERCLPAWLAAARAGTRSRTVRVWSAACSSGEEPFSIAMSLLSHLPAVEGWAVEIVATDISTQVLARARDAIWPMARSDSIPGDYKRRFMLRGRAAQEGKFAAGPELRRVVHFQQFNLHGEGGPTLGRFDLIFCRNVLIYFDQEGRRTVINRLRQHLVPGGHLFLGHAESLNGIASDLKTVVPTVFRAPDAAAR